MRKLYIVTGANGHLGTALIQRLKQEGGTIRGLILPQDSVPEDADIQYLQGDVRDKDSLRPLFEQAEGYELYVFHTAGIVSIAETVSPALYDVNVTGTKNILDLCREYAVKRLVYVSSVHAIPELSKEHVLREVDSFSPDRVVGGYAKTKAEATQAVLDAVKDGLNAVIVQPSGILGPYDAKGNHLVQLVSDYLAGKLPACVKGGYDFVDVRDVAEGCLAAMNRGETGKCYILSNRHYSIRELLTMVRKLAGGKKLIVLPMWMAKLATPLLQWIAKRRNKRPLFTRYSLYTLESNDNFSHDRATAELGFRPRDLWDTLKDTIAWLTHRRLPAV